ncbi:hypothetical protein D3C80_1884040 [compost metagenome]
MDENDRQRANHTRQCKGQEVLLKRKFQGQQAAAEHRPGNRAEPANTSRPANTGGTDMRRVGNRRVGMDHRQCADGGGAGDQQQQIE